MTVTLPPMSLFQKAPETAEEVASAHPGEIPPDQVQNMDEKEWYAKVYRGENVPQLTWRAVLLGSALGFLLAFTNLYVGLKAGWALGVVITAALVAYSLWNALLAAGFARTPMGVLEMNCMASTASSAGYATGGTMVSAIAALLMLSATPENPEGEHIALLPLVLWTACLGFLGTLMAIPMKRNMVNQERLKFPTGTAAAVTLQSLYSAGRMAMRKAKVLFANAAFGALAPILIFLNLRKDAEGVRSPLLPDQSNLFNWLPSPGNSRTGEATQPSDWTWYMDHDPVMLAAGGLMGLRVTLSMLLGGIILYYGLGEWGLQESWVSPSGETKYAITTPGTVWREAGLWFGVSILVSSSLLLFALQWKTILRAFRGFGGTASSGNEKDQEFEAKVAATEVPIDWFLWGVLIFGAAVVVLAEVYFEIPWYFGVLAVCLTFALSLVACRATGETDITPTGALGKIMQLTYGRLIPQNSTANLMTASITANAAGNSADLLSDLKSGYLLGANPRRQFLAQFMGVISGTFATVIGFRLLVPNAITLNGQWLENGTYLQPDFPAPAAVSWKAVAELFEFGLENMHPAHLQLIVAGLAVGCIIVAIERLAPKYVRASLPSATGVGMGMIFGFNFALSMILGAVAAEIWKRKDKTSADNYLVPAAAGIIAGVSLMGVVVAILNNTALSNAA